MGHGCLLREHAHAIDVLNAFMLGALSALPLGIGAFTAFLWKPTNFVLGLLTAFGAAAGEVEVGDPSAVQRSE